MSETNPGRALEFMSRPQDVRVHRGGTWVPGSMVGWRREEDSCRVMVRVAEGGVEKTAWADLHDLRLPERRICPPTESLPFLPRLPLGRTEEVTRPATSGGWADLRSPRDSADPVVSLGPHADLATEGTSLASVPTDDVGPETGRHRAPTGISDGGNAAGHGVRPSGARSSEVPSRSAPPMHGGHQAGAALASWWPSSEGRASPSREVEPTRLITLPEPRHWQAVALRHGAFVAH